MARMLKRAKMRHRVKFHRNQSNCSQHIAIFLFSKTVVAAILDFQNSKFSIVGSFKRVDMCHHAQFGQNRRNRCRDMAIFFRFFKMATVCHLGFAVWVIVSPTMVVLVVFITVQNLAGINAVVLMIRKF